MSDEELLTQVFLLAIWRKEPQESLGDILKMVVSTGVMSLKEGEEILSKLKAKGAIIGDGLSFVGVALAQEAQKNFAL